MQWHCYRVSTTIPGITNSFEMIKLRRIFNSLSSINGSNNANKPSGWRWNSNFSGKTRSRIVRDGNGSLLRHDYNGGGEKNVKFFEARRNFYSTSSSTNGFRISEEVRMGVERGEPVVALESAIVSHGMPFPHNIETAFHLQTIVRQRVRCFVIYFNALFKIPNKRRWLTQSKHH